MKNGLWMENYHQSKFVTKRYMEWRQDRAFQISCGLREGYDQSAPVHTLAEAREVIRTWIEQRTSRNQKIVVGSLVAGEFIYPWIEDSGRVASRFEPAFHYQGRVREDATDEDAKEMFIELAHVFAESFHQKRVHVEFGGMYWLVEKTDG